jgi:penicillin-binding protein 1A
VNDPRNTGSGWRARVGRKLNGLAHDQPPARGHRLLGRTRAYLAAKPPLQRYSLVALWGCAALLALLLAYVLVLIPLTPGIGDLKQARAARATVILSADGKQLADFEQGAQERIPLDHVSPNVVAALVATEDQRFYSHHGIDFKRSAAAVYYSLRGRSQGGSTITQQLARNMFPEEIGRARTLSRKVKEIITAIKIETQFSKKEILEAYLNTVPFLYNTFGIEMAARTYFDKSAARLDMAEAATLVGMLKGTNYYNPVTNPRRSLERRNVVLAQMRKHGIIDDRRYKALLKRPLRVRFTRPSDRGEGDTHFTTQVKRWLIQWADENEYNLRLDGLVVHTTLDSDLQQAAQQAVAREGELLQRVADAEWARADGAVGAEALESAPRAAAPFDYFWRSRAELVNTFVRETPEYRSALSEGASEAAALKRLRADRAFMAELKRRKTRLEAGLVAIDPLTGEVKAWIGSRDYRKDQFDHVAQAARQPGSTFKPIVYGAALERGIPPDRPYRDEVMTIKSVDGSTWRPTNMGGSSGAIMTLSDGLVYSKNTITAQVMQEVGVGSIVQLARDLGIRTSRLAPVPSLALGTSPVTLLEMTSAYATIASQGQYRPPVYIRRITNQAGETVAEFTPPAPQRAMSAESAATLIDILRGVISRGTGTTIRSRFEIDADVAGKTGTTQRNTDGWFIMMHPSLVVGSWVGFNDNRVTMRSNYWGQGGHNALLLVGDFFRTAVDRGRIDVDALFPLAHKPVQLEVSQPVDEYYDDPGYVEAEIESIDGYGSLPPDRPQEDMLEVEAELPAPPPVPATPPAGSGPAYPSYPAYPMAAQPPAALPSAPVPAAPSQVPSAPPVLPESRRGAVAVPSYPATTAVEPFEAGSGATSVGRSSGGTIGMSGSGRTEETQRERLQGGELARDGTETDPPAARPAGMRASEVIERGVGALPPPNVALPPSPAPPSSAPPPPAASSPAVPSPAAPPPAAPPAPEAGARAEDVLRSAPVED